MNSLPLLDFIFPRVCHICGETLSSDEKCLCSPCLSRLPRTLYHRQPGNPMEMRFAGRFPFIRATGHFFYSSDSDLASVIHDLKYRNYKRLARFLGETIGNELLSSGFFSDIDLIIPVPMHFLKKAGRGYNQTEIIAGGLSKAVSVPVDYSLKAVKPHVSQTGQSIEGRIRNLKDVFKLSSCESIENKHILLIDDICTTGATLTSAAEAIISAQPSARLSLLTVGVTF
ncbi:MAG: ComF family protein [Muribaculaceae bacterium]|nr:ComF family protein [Muribaculaceae bacterium]